MSESKKDVATKELGLVARIMKAQEEPDALSVAKFVGFVIRDFKIQIDAENTKLNLLKEANKTAVDNLKYKIEDAVSFEEEAYAKVPKSVLGCNTDMMGYINSYTSRISEKAEELEALEIELVREKEDFKRNSDKIKATIKRLEASTARCK